MAGSPAAPGSQGGAPQPWRPAASAAAAEPAAAEPLAAALIPLSGLALVLFLGLHLAGVALAVLDPDGFEALATTLHALPGLPLLELLLAAALLLHPLLALGRTLRNRRARGPVAGPLRSRRGGGLEGAAAMAGRWAPWSGALLALFLVVHLAQLRLQRPPAGAERDALLAALAPAPALALYALAGAAVAFHLLQGNESAHRSLGWLEPLNRERIRWVGRAVALVLGAGFSLVPLALVLQAFQAAASP